MSFRLVEPTPTTACRAGDLVYRVFGYTYSDAWIYDGAELLRRAERGDVVPLMVADPAGAVVGFFDYRYAYGDRSVVALGLLVLDPELTEVENLVVLNTLLRDLVRRIGIAIREDGLSLIVTTDTTDHLMTQRLSGHFGLTATGLTFGSVPADKHLFRGAGHPKGTVAADGHHRRAEVFSVYPVRRALEPYESVLPRCFRALLEPTYVELDLPVRFVDPVPPVGETRLACSRNIVRGIATIEVSHVGTDAVRVLRGRVAHERDGGMPVVHVRLPMGPADVDPLLDALSADGALYSALLPRFKGRDVVMLQYADDLDPGLDPERMAEPAARRVLDYARAAASMMSRASSQGLSSAIRDA